MIDTFMQHDVTEQQLKPYYDKVYQRADSITRIFIPLFFLAGIGLAFVYDTYGLGIALGGVAIVAFFILEMLLPSSHLLRYSTSFLFWLFALQFMFQMKGLFEIQLVFFVALTILLLYEDWKLLIPASACSIITLIGCYLYKDTVMLTNYLPGLQQSTTTSFIVHLSVLTLYSFLCIQWSIMQREQTHESAMQAIMMHQQLQMVEVNIKFSDSISGGNYNAAYPATTIDRLGESLLNMRDSLAEAARREERERFSTLGLARIGEIMRQHANSLDQLCDNVIMEIIKYMKANQGAIFMTEEKGSKNEHLKLMACRAWERKKYLEKTIKLGQGLVGQAAIEKQTIFLTRVPENYITISSGLGEANPGCILIVPLKFEDEVVGIIELAAFKKFADYEIEFMEKMGSSIASTMITTQNNQRNKELLEQARELTEQLREQEENIRLNMEEMQASQEEVIRKEKEIAKLMGESLRQEQLLKEREVESLMEKREAETVNFMKRYQKTLLNVLDQLPHKIFLKDHEGKMLIVNTVVAKAHHMSVEELIGKSDFDFVDARTAQEWRNQELEIIEKGSETYIFKEQLNGETKILRSTKMAFYIDHLDKIGLLGIQTDITEMQRLKEQVEETVLA
jgi:methyl-accepting chemotaxis protein